MAPKLVDFGHEVDRAVGQNAPGTPVTYVGHSYGGAIVGTAEQMGLRADRILHASSAGTGILPGGYTDPNPNVQRYSMTAPGDPIAIVQSLPRDVRLSDVPGVDQIPGIPHNVEEGSAIRWVDCLRRRIRTRSPASLGWTPATTASSASIRTKSLWDRTVTEATGTTRVRTPSITSLR